MDFLTLFSVSETPSVIFEDYYFLVVYKPAGFTVERHPSYASLEDFANKHVRETFPENKKYFIGIVHRLDVNVSGLVVLAKTRAALKHLNEQFANKSTRKIYLAQCENNPLPLKGNIDGWISEDKLNRKATYFKDQQVNTKACSLSYEVVDEANRIVKIELHTGRFHQIRASLAGINCPIVNDDKYGAKKISEENSIKLVACELHVKHPKTDERLKFELKHVMN
ncbi:MAG TPA: RluA family pseudouridine synthase [Flavobacteriales bacterium]|nr:RluA family pseudouridine synthase [Flavobacteriales bacterium]